LFLFRGGLIRKSSSSFIFKKGLSFSVDFALKKNQEDKVIQDDFVWIFFVNLLAWIVLLLELCCRHESEPLGEFVARSC